MMALGMGIGFEKNIPETDMEKQLGKTVNNRKPEQIVFLEYLV